MREVLKKMKIFRITLSLMLILSICILCGCENQSNVTLEAPSASGNFNFTVLKGGQADAIIMHTENYNIVLDVGEEDDGDEVVEYLEKNSISNVDYLFITHFDKDHVGGFTEVMENVTASNIIVPNYEGNNDEYEEYLKTVNDKDLKITSLTKDTSFILDDVLFEVSIPKKQSYAQGDNDFSLVLSVTHGDNTFLFAGDAEEDRLPEVLSEFGKQYDFLKVPHHGKHNKNTKRFINTVKPKYAVITDSDKNPASNKTTSLLESIGAKIYSTKNGDISVFSNGKEITVNQ